MSQNRPAANPKSVFVGNIPYDATEKELIDIFSEVGRVISFRLVEDRDLKKPKGYGFCEYADTETALSAIRNLNNRELNKRNLRVSYADNDKALMNELMQQQQGSGSGPSNGPQGGPVPNMNQGGPMNQPGNMGGPMNQPGNMGGPMNQPGNMGGPMNQPGNMGPQKDPIQSIIESTNSTQLFETLSKFKHFAITQPEMARNMLNSNPQIALALLHSQVVLGMMSPQTAQQLINKQSPGPMNPQFNQSPNMYQPMNQGNPMNMGNPMNQSPMGMNQGGPMNQPINMGQVPMNQGPMGMNQGGPMNMGGPMNQGPMGMNQGGPMNMGPNNNMMNQGPMGMNQGPMNMGGQNNNNNMMNQQNQNQNSSGGNTPPPTGISPQAMNNWNILNESQKQFVHYVINLTPQQIESQIPPNNRSQVLQIRSLYNRS